MSIGSAIFAGLTIVTHRQTRSVIIGRIYIYEVPNFISSKICRAQNGSRDHDHTRTPIWWLFIITTIKRTSIGDAAYAMSHAAAEACCTQQLAAGRVDGYQVTGSACSSKRRSTGRTCYSPNDSTYCDLYLYVLNLKTPLFSRSKDT